MRLIIAVNNRAGLSENITYDVSQYSRIEAQNNHLYVVTTHARTHALTHSYYSFRLSYIVVRFQLGRVSNLPGIGECKLFHVKHIGVWLDNSLSQYFVCPFARQCLCLLSCLSVPDHTSSCRPADLSVRCCLWVSVCLSAVTEQYFPLQIRSRCRCASKTNSVIQLC